MFDLRHELGLGVSLTMLLALGGCGDPRAEVAAAADRDIELRIASNPATEKPGAGVTAILETVAMPAHKVESLLAKHNFHENGNAIRREVEIAMRLNEAELVELLSARCGIGNTATVESFSGEKQGRGSRLKVVPRAASGESLSLKISHLSSRAMQGRPGEEWLQESLDLDSEIPIRDGEYLLLAAAKPDGEREERENQIFLLFLRADFR